MNLYSLSHLSDPALLGELAALVRQDRTTTARLLAHLAEVDARKLYLPAVYPSMHLYCVEELGFDDDVAFKRIRAARAARDFPAILPAVADGRLHLSAVVLLAPHLTRENAEELLEAAAHQSKAGILRLLAERSPRPDIPTRLEPLTPERRLDLDPVATRTQLDPDPVGPPAKVEPLSPERFALQVTIGQATHDKLRRLQELISHQVGPGDLAGVLDRALEVAITHFEKRRFAATDKPRPGRRSANPRHIPAAVRRAVHQRDGDCCTFVGENGRRCEERRFLELDHTTPVARGGPSTAGNLRLRCRAHNQHAADCEFGAGFMARKREQAAEAKAHVEEVVPWLQSLGLRADQARRAAEHGRPDASLEERVKLALACHARTRFPNATTNGFLPDHHSP
jgi:hypothetical protein